MIKQFFRAVDKPEVVLELELPDCPVCHNGTLKIVTFLQVSCLDCGNLFRRCAEPMMPTDDEIRLAIELENNRK